MGRLLEFRRRYEPSAVLRRRAKRIRGRAAMALIEGERLEAARLAALATDLDDASDVARARELEASLELNDLLREDVTP